MSFEFKIDGFFIPQKYDTNCDKNLSTDEINIFCRDNDLKYDAETQKISHAQGDYLEDDINNKLDPQKYSIESLKQRYPGDKYSIKEDDGLITVYDKNTNNMVIMITKGVGQTYIDMFDENDKRVYSRTYDKNGDFRCPIADNIYNAVSAKKGKVIPTTDVHKLVLNINKITPENIERIMNSYEYEYGQTLYDAIKNEWGLEK